MRTGHSIEVGLKALQVLNLTMVGQKLMESEPEGKGWNTEQVVEAEKWYRRYLELCVRYPEAPVVPNYPIDTFWHQHILDTRAYGEDCNRIFGEMLHHFPYFGLRGEQDAKNRDNAFDLTNGLYSELFGEKCTEMKTFFHNQAKFKGPHDGSTALKCGTCCGICDEGSLDSHPNELTLANNIEEILVGTGASQGMGCNHGGSGTGCGQGCSRSKHHEESSIGLRSSLNTVGVGMGCNGAGSGTGCGQRCGRNVHDYGRVFMS